MKVIRYLVLNKEIIAVPKEDGTYEEVEKDLLCEFERPYSEQNEELAKKEAYDGKYDIVDDGEPSNTIPTTEERVEALEAAVAMLCMPDVNEV